MRGKRLFAMTTAMFVAAMTSTSVCFAEDLALSQVYVHERYMDVFVAGNMNPDSLSVKVSNQAAVVTDSGLPADKGVAVRTTVLLDISTSVPSEAQDDVKAYIDSLIERIAKNEQFKIVTFGEQLTVLQDFTSDRYDLAGAASKIEFNGRQSKIYDAIYNTIPEVRPIEGEPCYYRTIVITDGIDDAASGVTKEELYLKLQADTYPIDVVAVSKTKQAEPEKELSALTRMSGGRYANIYPEADISGFFSSPAVSGVFWIRAGIPSSLLDGSTRQVDISDGAGSVRFDVKVSVFDAPASETPKETNPAVPPAESALRSPRSVMTLFGDYTLSVFIGAGVLLIIIVAAIVTVSVTRGKKRKQGLAYADANAPADGAAGGRDSRDAKTVFIGEADCSDVQFTIKLSNPNDPSKNRTLPVNGELLVGRAEHCIVRLDDLTVSQEQCKILVQGAGLAVSNLSRTNKTLLNGSNVLGCVPLQSGDTLKFGREVLHVDYIQSLGGPLPPRTAAGTSGGPKTESIF
jgi:hypothetical protein